MLQGMSSATQVLLENGDTIFLSHFDSAGPNQSLRLNSTVLFIKRNDEEWHRCDNMAKFKAIKWIEISSSWEDVVSVLNVDLSRGYGK